MSKLVNDLSSGTFKVNMPTYTWKCELFGTGERGMVLMVEKPPLLVWRWMQLIFFGNRWSRITPTQKDKGEL